MSQPLGRNLSDLLGLVQGLHASGVELESLTESLETGSPTGKLVFHLFAALAELERNLIRERTMAGLEAARARGRTGGRPRKLSPKDMRTIAAILETGKIPVQDVAAQFGVARSTLYRNFPGLREMSGPRR